MSKPPREDDPIEVFATDPDMVDAPNCALCVTCGADPNEGAWPITSSISCLVGAGCVVLPPDDFDDVVDRVRDREADAPAVRPPSS
jgi:hypothetical protein